jgi:hypothetical protein
MAISFGASNGSTGLSTTLNIGSAGNNRLVVVMLAVESTSASISAVTVDSKSCTKVTHAHNTNGAGNRTEMWYIDEDGLGSSNGTVTISATGSGNWAIHAHVYTGVDQDGPEDFGIDNTSVSTTTAVVNNIDCPANGVAIMVASNGQSGSCSSWTSPLTERTDGPNPNSAVMGTASGVESSSQSNKTYTCTFSTTHNRASAIVATWAEAVTADIITATAAGLTVTAPAPALQIDRTILATVATLTVTAPPSKFPAVEGDQDMTIRVRSATGTPKYKALDTVGVLTSTGMAVSVTQVLD